MNQQERDALRKKHTLEPYEDRTTGQEVATCAHCCTDEWPCDVIKVLDAWEAAATECDHVEGGEIPHTTEGINVWLHFTYCPLCGKKL